MTESQYLKPCPFCGGEAYLSQGQIGPAKAIADYVECLECAASADMFYDKYLAIEAWNRRI